MRRCVWLILAVLTSLAADAHAVTIYVDLAPKMEEVVVPVYGKKAITIRSPVDITFWHNGNTLDYLVRRTEDPRRVTVSILDDPHPNNLVIETPPWLVALRFEKAESFKEGASLVQLVPPQGFPRSDRDYLARKLNEKEASPPSTLYWQNGDHSLVARIGTVAWGQDEMSCRFELFNKNDSIAFPISVISVRDKWSHDQQLAIHAPGYQPNSGFVLKPGKTLVGALTVTNATNLRKGWELHIQTPSGVVPATFGWTDEKPRGPLEERLSLAMRFSGGAVSLGDDNETVWTATGAVGAEVRYGVSPHVSLQGILDFARTNSARLAEGGTTRDVRETVGRVMAGALLHTGKRWIPYGQIAVGARMSRHETTTNGETDSSFRVGPVFGLGGGLMVALGKRMMMGTSLALVMPFAGQTSVTAEVSINLGATWDLGDDW